MTTYRCFLMSGESIRAVQNLEGTNDAEVMSTATELLNSKAEYQNAEVWDGKRLVGRIPRHESETGAHKIVDIGKKKL